MPRAEIYAVSSQFQILALIAAIESGAFARAEGEDVRRVLLVSNNAVVAENATHPIASPVAAFARSYFSQLVDFNELLYPLKPVDFAPRSLDAPLLARLLRIACGIGFSDEVVLFLESLQSSPAKGLAEVFWDSELVVHADGLMVFGPSRERLSPTVGQRISTLIYPELLPELTPLLLAEHAPQYAPTPMTTFVETVTRFVEWSSQSGSPNVVSTLCAGDALVLGQYLSDLNILTPQEDLELAWEMVRTASLYTDARVVFKPHPSAAPSSTSRLLELARSTDIDLVVDGSNVPVEIGYALAKPAAVVSAFSTGLVTAHASYGLPAYSVGTELLLERLRPFENSNRIPVTICDALFVHPAPLPLAQLVEAVSYAMQSQVLPGSREAAEGLIAAGKEPVLRQATGVDPEEVVRVPVQPAWRRYIKRKRAEALGLVGPPAHVMRAQDQTNAFANGPLVSGADGLRSTAQHTSTAKQTNKPQRPFMQRVRRRLGRLIKGRP